jgi:6-pyruvoyltetrahydropterin/6-carboxytetrahydropterin synthase
MELRFKYRFEAAHRFTQSSSPSCMTPHGHTWYATLHLQSSSPLNANDMAVEFFQLKSSWKALISDVFDHSYMCNSTDPLIEPLLKIHGAARLILFPGDPTTELISLLMFNKCEKFISESQWKNQVSVSGITIDETPTNSIHCDRAFYLENISRYATHTGWWSTSEIAARNCIRVEAATNK